MTILKKTAKPELATSGQMKSINSTLVLSTPTKISKKFADILVKNNYLDKKLEKFWKELLKEDSLKIQEKNSITETSHLHLISGGSIVKISACKGGDEASLAYAQKTFTGFLDDCFKSWGLNNSQPETQEVEAEVWEMATDGNYETLFGSFKVPKESLIWESQKQIEKFCIENRQWIRTGGYGTFFLFKEKVNGKEEFFVADVFLDGERLEVYADRFSYDSVWGAEDRHRLVVPATWRLVS